MSFDCHWLISFRKEHVATIQQLTWGVLQELSPSHVQNGKPELVEKFDVQHFAHLLTFRVICRYTCSMDLASVAGRDYEEQAIKDVCFGNSVSLDHDHLSGEERNRFLCECAFMGRLKS